MKVSVVCDGKVNHYYYDAKKCVRTKQVFGSWVNYWYDVKQKHKAAKPILSSLWGKMMEKHINKYYITEDQEDVDFDKYGKVLMVQPCKVRGKGGYKVFVQKEKIYKSSWARIGCFLTAFARRQLARTAMPYAKHIVRIHTDAFTVSSDIKLDTLKFGKGLGEWKVEKNKSGPKIRIPHVNKIVIEK
jgi:hypothetical protein